MTTLYITVGDREQLREDALAFVHDADAGDRNDGDDTAILQFRRYDD